MNQSCGKCVPCRDGLEEVEGILDTILSGNADPSILLQLEELCQMIVESADCVVGISAAELILDSLKEFPDEYESHICSGHCTAEVKQTIPCISLCPAHVNVPGYISLINKGDYASKWPKFMQIKVVSPGPQSD